MWSVFAFLLETTSTVLAIGFVLLNGFVAVFGFPKSRVQQEIRERMAREKLKRTGKPFRLLDLPDVPTRKIFCQFPDPLLIYDVALTSQKFSEVLKHHDTSRSDRETLLMEIELDNECDTIVIKYRTYVKWRFVHDEEDLDETNATRIVRILGGRPVEIFEHSSLLGYHHEYTVYAPDHSLTMFVADHLLEVLHARMYEFTMNTSLDTNVVLNSKAFMNTSAARSMRCNALRSDQLRMVLDTAPRMSMKLDFDAPADFEYHRPINCHSLCIRRTDWLNSHIFLNLIQAENLDLFNVRSLTARDFNLFMKQWADKTEKELSRQSFYWLTVETVLPIDGEELKRGIDFSTDRRRGDDWEGMMPPPLENGELQYIERGNYLARLNFNRFQLTFSSHFDAIHYDFDYLDDDDDNNDDDDDNDNDDDFHM